MWIYQYYYIDAKTWNGGNINLSNIDAEGDYAMRKLDTWGPSHILTPSKAAMFFDMPCWGDNPPGPHDGGVNVVFYDGHTQLYRTADPLSDFMCWALTVPISGRAHSYKRSDCVACAGSRPARRNRLVICICFGELTQAPVGLFDGRLALRFSKLITPLGIPKASWVVQINAGARAGAVYMGPPRNLFFPSLVD